MSTILDERPTSVRVVSVVAGLPVLFVVYWVVSFFSVPSAETGWLPTAAIVLPFVFAILAGVGVGRRFTSTAAAALAIALLLGAWAYRTAPPEPERLAAVAAEVGTPSQWREISSVAGGSTWGLFGDLPRFDAVHATSEPADQAVGRYVALLEADGWKRVMQPSVGPPPRGAVRQVWRRDRWVLTFTVAEATPEGLMWHDEIAVGETRISIDVGH